MNLTRNRCGNCGKRGGFMTVTEFDGQKIPGTFCKKCGMFRADPQSERFDVSCGGCKKTMHNASRLIDIVHVRTVVGSDKKERQEKTLLQKGEERKTYMCVNCSKARVEKGLHDIDDVLTRYLLPCKICGSHQGYIDAPEGTENVSTAGALCETCAPRGQELMANDKAIDIAVKNVAGVPSDSILK